VSNGHPAANFPISIRIAATPVLRRGRRRDLEYVPDDQPGAYDDGRASADLDSDAITTVLAMRLMTP
jgi:hypothetical protein